MAGRGLGRGAGDTEGDGDGIEDSRELLEDEVVGEAKHADAAAAEVLRSVLVIGLRRRLEVLAAVELDSQMFRRAIEVQDERAAGMLAVELEVREPFRS